MKYLALTALVFINLTAIAQSPNASDADKIKNSRISFVLGVGASYVPAKLYQNPAINKTNNNVIIEEGQKQKTNLSLGIVYTPYLYKIKFADGSEEKVPMKISFAAFINPVNLTKASNAQSFFDITDFGVGLGYKFAGNVMIMGTAEWFGVRQPRKWFIDDYKGNNKPFLINNAPQQSFDLSDNNIFENKIVTTFGFKICYTFDIIKSYYKTGSKPTE